MNFVPFNPFSEPPWPYWWGLYDDDPKAPSAVALSFERVLESGYCGADPRVQLYSYVVVPQ